MSNFCTSQILTSSAPRISTRAPSIPAKGEIDARVAATIDQLAAKRA
jgi:hypothetical protein